MPLAQGSSKKVIAKNIKKLLQEGKYPKEQAIAIAYSEAEKGKKDDKKD